MVNELQVVPRWNKTGTGKVLDQLAEHLPGLVILDAPTLGQHRVTGVFDLTRPDAALEALIAPQGGHIKAYSPWLRVVQGPAKKITH